VESAGRMQEAAAEERPQTVEHAAAAAEGRAGVPPVTLQEGEEARLEKARLEKARPEKARPEKAPSPQPEGETEKRSRAPSLSPVREALVGGASVPAGGLQASPGQQHLDALLPKQTVVKIIGNNRTKSDLVGKQGVVKGAQTLGGWHEVLLDHGGFVRVQRNALEVISVPAISTVLQMVAPMGVAVPDRGQLRTDKSTGGDMRGHNFQSLVRKRKASSQLSPTHVNIDRLDLASLRRYKKVFNLNVSKDCPRDELVFAVRRHFAKIKVDEKEVIFNFVRRLTRRAVPTTLNAASRKFLSERPAKYA